MTMQQSQPPAPLPTPFLPHRPSALLYGVAVAVLIAGLALAGWRLYDPVSTLVHLGDTLKQHVAPGTFAVRVDTPGDQKIYLETRSRVGGEHFAGSPAGVRFEVKDPDGKPVPVDAPHATETYEFAGRSGALAATFAASQKGTYRLAATAEGRERFVIAVGSLPIGRVVWGILAGIGIAAGFTVVAFGIWLWTFLRRRSPKSFNNHVPLSQ